MSENPYSNLDARAVWAQAQRIGEISNMKPPFEAQTRELLQDLFPLGLNKAYTELLAAAQHLQSMDEKLSRRIEGDFAQGALWEKKEAIRLRSNLLRHGREITNDDGERVIAALAEPQAKVRKIPFGLRATPKPQVVEIDPRKSAPARTGFKLGDL